MSVKILIVSQYFWPETFRINDLAIALVERGHEVTVLTGIPNYPSGKFFPEYGLGKKYEDTYHGVKIKRVPLFPRQESKGWQLAINYLSFMFFASLLSPIFCRDQYDLIFVAQFSPVTVGIPAIILKKIKKIPILFWIQDLWPESLSATGAVKSKGILQMVGKVVKFIYSHCDHILVQSRGFISNVNSMGVLSHTISYFPNWAEELYKPMKLEINAPEYAKLPQGFNVMFAGNIGAAQDFENILDAVERLKVYPDIHVVVLGDGRMQEWVEEQVKVRGLTQQVHLLGRYPVEAMPRFFALADVMLVTLKSQPIFALTIPSKIQSYLACGKPMIAALEGEGGNVIRESGAGMVCPPENPKALAETILAMYQQTPAQREKMGEKGRTYFESHFEREMLLNKLEECMKNLQQ